MQILISQILCVDKIGSRRAAACGTIISITTTTKISAPGRLQHPDFPPPVLLVYETHNEGRLGKKCDTWAKDTESDRTLTLQIPTMLILISQILCVGKIGSRRAAACETSTTTTTKISAPGRPQKPDFPPPVLLVYETHNEGRLKKTTFRTQSYRV